MKVLALFLYLVSLALAATKDKPHGHKGVIEPFTGQLLPFTVTKDQETKLGKGESITFNERVGKSGRGVVIQDVNASTTICLDKIRDLSIYPKVVPNVKRVDIYESITHKNGTAKTAAKFDIGVLGMRFGYFLILTHEPKYGTVTWTLDYRYNSDFDDNVGHWQVMKHPSKVGWSRILYSTKVKLFPWIPELIVNFLTKKALTESTSWVKKVSEAEQVKQNIENAKKAPTTTKNPLGDFKNPFADVKFDKSKLPAWMNLKGGKLSKESPENEVKNGEIPSEEKIPRKRVVLPGNRILPFLRFPRAGFC